MKNYLFNITREEKCRILEMHSSEKKLINEQFDEVGPNKHDCLKSYLNLAFKPTKYDDEDDIDFSDGSSIIGGGDLGLWNDNKVPSIDDESAFKRFVKYLKSVSSKENALYDDDECTGIYFDDMKPILKELYFQKIEELSNRQNMGDGFKETTRKNKTRLRTS